MKFFFAASVLVLMFCVVSFAQTNQTAPCPKISIIGPAGIVDPGEVATFTADIDAVNQESYIFHWTVTSGDIVEEQGKSYLSLGKSFEETGKRTIKVLHSTDMVGENLTATVEIKGLPDGCSNTVSETMAISIDPGSAVIDEFSISATQIDKNRLELLVKAAKENSSAQIYIIEKFKKKTSPKIIQLKNQKTIDYLKTKGVERNNITLLNATSDKNLTQLMIVPAGVSSPICNECVIVQPK